MSQALSEKGKTLDVQLDNRFPHHKVRITNGSQIIRKNIIRINPTVGAMDQLFSASTNGLDFVIGSASKSTLLDPRESYLEIRVSLPTAATDHYIYNGHHTLIRSFSLSHVGSDVVLSQVNDNCDILAQASLSFMSKSFWQNNAIHLGSNISGLTLDNPAPATSGARLIAPLNTGNGNAPAVAQAVADGTQRVCFKKSEVIVTRAHIDGKKTGTLFLPDDLFNGDSLIPIHYIPLKLHLALNEATKVFCIPTGSTQVAIADYAVSITYVATTYTMDDTVRASMEASIRGAGLLIDYERVNQYQTEIQAASTDFTFSINVPNVRSLNKIMLCMVPHAALNDQKRWRYGFGDGSRALDIASTATTLTEFQVQLGDLTFPSGQPLTCKPNAYNEIGMHAVQLGQDGESMAFLDRDHSQNFQGNFMNDNMYYATTGADAGGVAGAASFAAGDKGPKYYIADGVYRGGLASQFVWGFDLRRSSKLQSGLSCTSGPIGINLKFNAVSDKQALFVFLFYSSYLKLSNDGMSVFT